MITMMDIGCKGVFIGENIASLKWVWSDHLHYSCFFFFFIDAVSVDVCGGRGGMASSDNLTIFTSYH